jgi:hypothetical protein
LIEVIRGYAGGMVKTLEQAIAEVAALPDADQEQIGPRILSHDEKLRRLREELDKDARSIDEGKGTTFNIEEFIRQTTSSMVGRRGTAIWSPEVPSGDAVSIDPSSQRTEGIGGLVMVARGAR